MLYVMLVGAYPFERPEDKHDNQKLQKMIQVGVGRAGKGGERKPGAPAKHLPALASRSASSLNTSMPGQG